MEEVKVLNFIEQKKDYLFPNDKYSEAQVEEALELAPDTFELTMNAIPFKDPSVVKAISFFVGSIGVDRFYLGDVKMGILKYFSFGGIGIWWIKDIISAKSRCRAYNCKKLIDAVNDPSVVAQMQQSNEKIQQAINIAKASAPVVKSIKDGAKSLQDDMMPF